MLYVTCKYGEKFEFPFVRVCDNLGEALDLLKDKEICFSLPSGKSFKDLGEPIPREEWSWELNEEFIEEYGETAKFYKVNYWFRSGQNAFICGWTNQASEPDKIFQGDVICFDPFVIIDSFPEEDIINEALAQDALLKTKE